MAKRIKSSDVMPVVKQRQAERLTRSALVLDLGDLGRQAEAIIAKGRAEAEAIVAAAKTEAQKLIDSAEERGHAAGL